MTTQQALTRWLAEGAAASEPPLVLLDSVLSIPTTTPRPRLTPWAGKLAFVAIGAVLLIALLATAILFGGLKVPVLPQPSLPAQVVSPTSSPGAIQTVVLETPFPSSAATESLSATESPTATIPALTPIPVTCQAPAPTPAPGSSALRLGQLAYTLGPDLYLADADGCNARLIASNAYEPAWYGSVLSYTDESTKHSSLVALEADGTLRDIGPNGAVGFSLRLSPDGKAFALLSAKRLTIVAPDNSRRDLLLPAGFAGWDASDWASLSWMPDGSTVLVGACKLASACLSPSSKVSTVHGLFLVPLDGSPATLLGTSETGQPLTGALLSPDGTHIAYETCDTGGDCYALGIMNSDGSNRRIVVAPEAGGWYAEWTYVWSADSTQLAYSYDNASVNSGQGVWVVATDGSSSPQQLTPTSVPATPDPGGNEVGSGGYWIQGWAPDGSAVLARGPFGEPTEGLQSIPTDGSTPTLLVPNVYMGAWQWVPNQ